MKLFTSGKKFYNLALSVLAFGAGSKASAAQNCSPQAPVTAGPAHWLITQTILEILGQNIIDPDTAINGAKQNQSLSKTEDNGNVCVQSSFGGGGVPPAVEGSDALQ